MQLTLIIDVCCGNPTANINKLCGQMAEFCSATCLYINDDVLMLHRSHSNFSICAEWMVCSVLHFTCIVPSVYNRRRVKMCYFRAQCFMFVDLAYRLIIQISGMLVFRDVNLFSYCHTRSMQQGPSCEAKQFSASQENSLHFMEPECSLPHSQALASCPYLSISPGPRLTV